jgi:hypothetical protein
VEGAAAAVGGCEKMEEAAEGHGQV